MALKDTLERIQEEQKVWADRNFGEQPSWMSLMGAIEEIGELAHAHLKEAQSIRNHEDHSEKAKDAIGDTVIFLCGYCSARGWKLAVYEDNSYTIESAHTCIFSASASLGWAATLFADKDQIVNTYINSAINSVISALKDYCKLKGWDFEAVISETWDTVKQRDWKKNPDKAHEA